MNVHQEMRDKIRKHGRTCMGVGAGSSTPAFTYTIGNTQRGLPELLVIDLLDGWVLNTLSQMMIDRGSKFSDGEIVSLGGDFPCCIIDAAKEVQDIYTLQAGHFFKQYHVMQVVIPDKKGRFPWDADCEKPFALVPVYRRMQS